MIVLKSNDEIEKIRRSCRVVAEILGRLKDQMVPGISTWDLDVMSEQWAAEAGARPAFKGYNGFPKALCTSVNEQVVHGIPSKRMRLKEGDIVSIDFGVVIDGFFGDAAITVEVGKVSDEAQRLCRATRESLMKGIEQAVVGNRLSDISHAVQAHVEARGFSVVREFVGHGIGRKLHESPQIPNYGPPGRGVKLQAGMVLAIEPMINAGQPEIEILDDKWTAVTRDGKLSAHFEHTIAITGNGPDILSVC